MEIKNHLIIDENTGREIAAREGIGLVIVPGISEIGNKYVLTAKIQDTGSGDLLKSEVMFAQTKDDILPAVDRLCRKIRKDLGESRYMISTQDKPLTRVTTSSLDALKLFSLGIDAHFRLDFNKARDYYERALQIDTGFTAAKASLGNILVERFDPEKGKELLRQAVRSLDNLTDKEKYGILGFYAVNVENDIWKGIDYTRRLTDLYPDDPSYHNNLGWYCQQAGQFEVAAEEYKAAVRINPTQALSYGGLLWLYLEKLGKPDSAMIWAQKMITDNPQNAWGYYYLGSALFCNDSLAQAEKAYRKAGELNPSLTLNLFRLAYTCSIRGNYDEAINILEKVSGIDPEMTMQEWYAIGVINQLKGKTAEANRYFEKYRGYASDFWMKKFADSPYTYICLGNVAARTGDMKQSGQMLQKAIDIDSTLHNRFAEVLCLQGNIPAAINQMEKAINNGYRDLTWIKMNPDLQALQYDIRFRDMLRKHFNTK